MLTNRGQGWPGRWSSRALSPTPGSGGRPRDRDTVWARLNRRACAVLTGIPHMSLLFESPGGPSKREVHIWGTPVEMSSASPQSGNVAPAIPAAVLSRDAMTFKGTSVSRLRHRSSRSPSPCQSASFDPNAYGASRSASRRSSRHARQSSGSERYNVNHHSPSKTNGSPES